MKNKGKLSNIRVFTASAIFLVLILQEAIVDNTSGIIQIAVSYFDDVLVCFFGGACFIKFILKKLQFRKIEIFLIASFGIFLAFGLISNVITKYQPIFVALTDVISCSRFVVIYFGVRCFIVDKDECNRIIKIISIECKILIVAMFALVLHDLLFNPFFEKDLNAIKLYYSTPTALAACSFSCACAIMLGATFKEKKYSDWIFILFSLLCACATLRTKAFGGTIVVIVFYILFCIFDANKFVEISGCILGTVCATIIGFSKIKGYYFSDWPTARNIMTRDCIYIANHFFPFGSGFGTFGSSAALKNTSPLYLELNYPQFLEAGLNKWNAFICDVFWQIIIAQTGWIGFIAFTCSLAAFFVLAFEIKKKNKRAFCAVLSALTYLIISSFGEPAFFQPMIANMFVVFALAVNVTL